MLYLIMKVSYHKHEEESIPIPYLEFLAGSVKNFQLFSKEDEFELKLCWGFEESKAKQ